MTQPARHKPAHIFEGPGAAASAAYVACCAAHEAQNIADDAEKIVAAASRRAARASRRAAKAAVCASYFIDDLCEKCHEAIEDAIEKYDWTPGEKGVEESDDDEKEIVDENDNDDDESDEFSEDIGIDDDGNNNNVQRDMHEKKDADADEDEDEDEDEAKKDVEKEERKGEQDLEESIGGTQHDGEEKAKDDVNDTYYWHVGTGAVDDIPPETFREQPVTEKAGTIMVEVQNATGVRRADLKGRYVEEEHAAASAGWPNWDGADLRRWVDAHVSQTPLTHTGRTVLRRTRVSEFVVERHKRNGTYISPQNMPMVGLPADDPLIQAPWAVQYRQDERQRKEQHERGELEHD